MRYLSLHVRHVLKITDPLGSPLGLDDKILKLLKAERSYLIVMRSQKYNGKNPGYCCGPSGGSLCPVAGCAPIFLGNNNVAYTWGCVLATVQGTKGGFRDFLKSAVATS